MRIRLELDYIGTAYAGWQTQPGQRTVQGEIERALQNLTGEAVRVTASGRTDAGVHALCQTAHFDTGRDWDAGAFVGGLNRYLPRDIRVLAAEKAGEEFHARFSAKGKTYVYLMYLSDAERAAFYGRAARLPVSADIAKMRDAARYFPGTHDFAAFCASGADTTTTVRTVTEAAVERDGDLVTFTVSADGFLYNMVRIMTGLLIRIGTGKEPPDTAAAVLASRDRTEARDTAPACGLYLKKVYY